jgi:hypothetical protein
MLLSLQGRSKVEVRAGRPWLVTRKPTAHKGVPTLNGQTPKCMGEPIAQHIIIRFFFIFFKNHQKEDIERA